MQKKARIQTSIELLEVITGRGLPMDLIIGDYMRNRRYIGSKDRKAIVELCYDVMRHWGRLHGVLENPSARDLVVAYLLLGRGYDFKELQGEFDGSKFAPEPMDDAEVKKFGAYEGKSFDDFDLPEHRKYECPEQFYESLKAYFGDDFADEMQAMMHEATLDLRVNINRTTREEAQESLAKDKVATDIMPYSPWGLRCKEKVFLSDTKAFKKKLVDIQDEGSQMIAYLCDAQPGMQVLDYCAGAGGKTLALAMAMQSKGRVVAMDIDGRRLEKARVRLKKAFMTDNIEFRPLDDEKHRKWLRRQKESFDVVLTDVPCSGTGTWRRNPDARWFGYGPSLQELVQTQAEILDRVAPRVKIGGKLVYATCSILHEENEAQIEAFLARNPEYKIVAVDEAMGIGSPTMRLTPHRHNTDGFFAAVMERVSA